MESRRVVRIWGLGLAVWIAAAAGAAQTPSLGGSLPEAHVQDLMRLTQNESELLEALWIPTALIEMGQSSIPAPQLQREQLLALLDRFLIVFVSASRLGPLGRVTPKTEGEIRTGVRLFDLAGRSYRPLADESVPADVRILVSAIRANSGVGEDRFCLLVFPGVDASGRIVADARAVGALLLRLGELEVYWKLPLGSFLGPKTCPVDGESMNGAWRYCPWHGSVLGTGPLRVRADLPPPRKIHDVAPVYPDEAKKSRIQGPVMLEAIVSTWGAVTNVRVLQSIPALDQAAIDAVRQWRYEPTLHRGEPVPVVVTVTVHFALTAAPR